MLRWEHTCRLRLGMKSQRVNGLRRSEQKSCQNVSGEWLSTGLETNIFLTEFPAEILSAPRVRTVVEAPGTSDNPLGYADLGDLISRISRTSADAIACLDLSVQRHYDCPYMSRRMQKTSQPVSEYSACRCCCSCCCPNEGRPGLPMH